MSPFCPFTDQQINFAPCRACEIEANDEQVKQMPIHTCGKDGPIERAELKQVRGSVAAPKEEPKEKGEVELAAKKLSANLYKENKELRDQLRQRDELIKELLDSEEFQHHFPTTSKELNSLIKKSQKL